MSKTFLFWASTVVLMGCVALFLNGISKASPGPETASTPSACAVVELFTSEGCSSCPPADAFLGELVEEAKTKNRPIYAMEFHVDYWNHLGWSDPFSDAAYSQRQTEYGRAFKLDSIYTPQMVVNGATQFVGSDRDAGRRAIDRAMSAPRSEISVNLTKVTSAAKRYEAAFQIKGAPVDAVLNVALIEGGLSTVVPRGENGGRTLRHTNVVRFFKTLPVPSSGEGVVQVVPPQGFDASHGSIVAYIQAPALGKIVCASAILLPVGTR